MPADGADKNTSALAAHRSVQIARASCGSASANVLPAYDSTKACSSPRLGDELVQDVVGDLGLGCLDAIADRRRISACHTGNYALSALKMGFACIFWRAFFTFTVAI
jgi:hypothetical protein